ncbi:hypothetical protein T492DRAFT_985103 [Pavlovales sp. CCMP2436]|nr:hypothetical protein T492DRAFT_985103 [Pavlovales sp. CCMP2436]
MSMIHRGQPLPCTARAPAKGARHLLQRVGERASDPRKHAGKLWVRFHAELVDGSHDLLVIVGEAALDRVRDALLQLDEHLRVELRRGRGLPRVGHLLFDRRQLALELHRVEDHDLLELVAREGGRRARQLLRGAARTSEGGRAACAAGGGEGG